MPAQMEEKTEMQIVTRAFNGIKKNYMIALIDIVLIIFLMISFPQHFLHEYNWDSLQTSIAPIAIIAVGMMVLLISGNFDLSVGSNMNLSAFITTMMVGSGENVFVAVLAGLLVGAIIGIANGLLVAYANVNPLITTIGMMYIVKGLADVLNTGRLLGGTGQGLYSQIVDLPEEFTSLGTKTFGTVYGTFILMLVLGIVTTIFLAKTTTGRNFYYLGGNPEAAKQMGIKTKALVLGGYIFTGVLAALSGILSTARLQSASRNLGLNTHLTVLISCIIGGGSMRGGKGRIFGAILGAVFSSLLTNMFNLFEVNTLWQRVVMGAVLVSVVFIDGFFAMVEQRKLGKI